MIAEIIGEAMLGPVSTEANWLMLTLDTSRYRHSDAMEQAAEEVLAELRNCPPAKGFDKVEVPGERERDHKHATAEIGVSLPEQTWNQIAALSQRLQGVA